MPGLGFQEFLTQDKKYFVVVTGISTCAIAFGIYKLVKFWLRDEGTLFERNENSEQDEDEYFESFSSMTKNGAPKTNKKIVVLGLEGSGKSRFVQCYGNGDVEERTRPTVGFNVKSLHIGSAILDFWDVGGSAMCRQYWKQFLSEKNVVIWVVDASNTSALGESVNALSDLLQQHWTGQGLLLVASKQDLTTIKPIKRNEIEEKFVCASGSVIREKKIPYEIVEVQVPFGGERKGMWAAHSALLRLCGIQ